MASKGRNTSFKGSTAAGTCRGLNGTISSAVGYPGMSMVVGLKFLWGHAITPCPSPRCPSTTKQRASSMSWQALSTRVASFTAPPKPAGARPTRGQQKTSWPHPPSFRANPATLAEAGFYYAPSSSDLDNVVCFMCAKELSDWEAEDDPFQIHAAKCPKCPWVVVRCALAQDLDDEGK